MREQEKKIEKIWARISRLWQISKAKIVYSSKRIYRHLSGRFFLYTKGKWMFISIKDMFLITRHHHGKYIQMMKCNLIWQVTFKILLLTAWLVCAVVELQPISGFFGWTSCKQNSDAHFDVINQRSSIAHDLCHFEDIWFHQEKDGPCKPFEL